MVNGKWLIYKSKEDEAQKLPRLSQAAGAPTFYFNLFNHRAEARGFGMYFMLLAF